MEKIASYHKNESRTLELGPNTSGLQQLKIQSKTNYHSLYAHSAIMGLLADPRPQNSRANGGGLNTLMLDGGSVQYRIKPNGNVQILRFNLDLDYATNEMAQKRFGALHRVQRKSEIWVPSKDPIMQIETHYAAVHSQGYGIGDAARLMPEHIIGAYGDDDDIVKTTLKESEGYSLYYNPVKRGFLPGMGDERKGAARRIAQAMRHARDEGKEVKWLVHGTGIIQFCDAMALLAKEGVQFEKKQQVFFSRPLGGSVDKALRLRRQIGLDRPSASNGLGYNISKLGFAENVLSGNAVFGLVADVRSVKHKEAHGFDVIGSASRTIAWSLLLGGVTGAPTLAAGAMGVAKLGYAFGMTGWAIQILPLLTNFRPRTATEKFKTDVGTTLKHQFR